MTEAKVVICPYCGETQPPSERCRACGGLFEPLSRQATHNAMGPWFVRDTAKPFQPGCSYETLVRMVDRGQVTKYSIIRGPTTKQFWTVSKHVPGVAHLLGYCHNCDTTVDPSDHGCHACGVPFGAYLDRDYLGLPGVRPLPWEAELEGGAKSGSGAQPDQAGTISRFASDDELLATGSAAVAQAEGQAGGRGRATPHGAAPSGEPGASTQAVKADTEAHSVFDDYTSSAVTRALRRKIAHQQRTIRLIMVILFVAIVIAVGSNVIPLAPRLGDGGDETEVPTPATPEAQRKAAVPEAPKKAASPGQPEAVGPGEAAEIATETSNGTMPVESGQQPVGPTASVIGAAYAKALELISLGEQKDRSLDDRIGDYEQALKSLTDIHASAPNDERPQNLDARIVEVKRELERLRLEKEFFG